MTRKTATSGRRGRSVAQFCAILRLGSDAALGGGRLEKLEQFPLDGLVAGDDAAFVQHIVVTLGIAYEGAGFAQHHNPGGKIPGMQVPLPEAVEPARSSPSEVKRGSAKPPDSRGGSHDGAQFLEEQIMRGLSAVRNAGADHRGRELRACCDPDAAIVEKGAFALFGGKGFLIGRIEDESRNQLAFALERDRDGEDWNAMEEIGGAVEWIDDPAMAAVAAFDIAALLHQEAVAWTRAGKFGEENLLGAVVRGADEVGRTFERDL